MYCIDWSLSKFFGGLVVLVYTVYAQYFILQPQGQIASRLGIPVADVQNVIIWGNHSSTQFPDVRHATAVVSGQKVSVYDAVKDDNYLKGEFITVSR